MTQYPAVCLLLATLLRSTQCAPQEMRVHASGYCRTLGDIWGLKSTHLYDVSLSVVDPPEGGGTCEVSFWYKGRSVCNARPTYFVASTNPDSPLPPDTRVIIKEVKQRKDFCSSSSRRGPRSETVLNTTDPTLLALMNFKTVGPEFSIEISSNETTGFVDVVQRFYRSPNTSDSGCKCPDGFVQMRCFCYAVHRAVQKNVTSWLSAEQTCSTLTPGGHLVSIVDSEEMEYIKHFMRSVWWEVIKETEWLLIGLEDQNKTMTFRWSDGSPASYMDWYHTVFASWLPSNVPKGMYNGTSQPSQDVDSRCGLMFVNKARLLDRSQWFMVPCDDSLDDTSKVAFMCKVPAVEIIQKKNPAPKLDHVTRSPPEIVHCDDSWTMLNNKCYKMLQIPGNKTSVEADTECMQLPDANLAKLDHDTLNSLLLVWRYREWNGKPIFTETNPDVSVGKYLATDEYKDMLLVFQEYLKEVGEPGFQERKNRTLAICERLANTTQLKCKDSLFQCNDGLCISRLYVSDGVVTCAKGEDEVIEYVTPKSSDESETPIERRTLAYFSRFPMFTCESGEKILYSFYCDLVIHCQDGSDESECVYPPCLSRHFRCDNGQCIPEEKRCDSVNQCLDGSDEANCEKCNGTCSSSSLCESNGDCMDGQKDRYAEGTELLPRTCTKDSANCHVTDSSCFERTQTCIYDTDETGKLIGCPDGSHLRFCKNFECPGMYKCPNSYCIPVRRLCDGTLDCPRGEDEAACENYKCQPGYFRCHGQTSCLPQEAVCDGVFDCPELDDESICWSPSCPHYCECSGLTVLCSDRAKLDDIPEDFRAIALRRNRHGWQHEAFLHRHLLGWLDLSRNDLKLVPLLNQLMNLRYLDLTDNKISFLGAYVFQGLVNLRKLNLAGNKITEISSGSFTGFFLMGIGPKKSFAEFSRDPNLKFYGLVSLQHLDLSRNDLRTIYEHPFDDCRNLSNLDIRKNNLDPIDPTVFKFAQLDWLHTDDFSHCCAVRQHARNCTDSADEFSTCEDLMSRQELQIAIWLMGFLSVLSNTFVICVRWRRKKDNAVERALVINLSVSDLLMGIYLLIIASVDTYFRGVYYTYHIPWRKSLLCITAGVLSFVSSEMSVFTLVFITCGRAVAIVYPFSKRLTSKKALAAVLLIAWGAIFSFAVLPVIFKEGFGNYYGHNGVCLPFAVARGLQSTVKHDVYNAMFLVVNLLAFIIIVTGYLAIYTSIRKPTKTVNALLRKPGREEEELRFLKKMSLIILTDFCCWMPIIFIKFLELSGLSIISPTVSAWVAVFVLPLNAALNPLLYTSEIAGFFCKCCSRTGSKPTVSNSTKTTKTTA